MASLIVRAPRAAASTRAAPAGASVARQARLRRVDVHAVPQLAGHLLVLLVEPLAVVGELAAPHEVAIAEADLPEPVGIGQRLAGGADEVRVAALEDGFRLLERPDAAAGDDGGVAARLADGAADARGQRHVAAEGAARVGQHGRHALVARAPRVGVDGLADARLLGILEAPALGHRQVIHAGLGDARA